MKIFHFSTCQVFKPLKIILFKVGNTRPAGVTITPGQRCFQGHLGSTHRPPRRAVLVGTCSLYQDRRLCNSISNALLPFELSGPTVRLSSNLKHNLKILTSIWLIMFLLGSLRSTLKRTESLINLKANDRSSMVGGALGGLELGIGQHLTRRGGFISTCGSLYCTVVKK